MISKMAEIIKNLKSSILISILALATWNFGAYCGKRYNQALDRPKPGLETKIVQEDVLEVSDVNESKLVVEKPKKVEKINEVNYVTSISQKAIDFIKSYEKFKDTAYPCPAGVWTIGYGHTKGVKQGDKITEKQARAYLAQDIAIIEKAISNYVKVPLTQEQYDTMGSFIFNVRLEGFKESTLLKKLNERKYSEVSEQIKKWNKYKGKVRQGLINRRKDEIEILEKKDYVRDY